MKTELIKLLEKAERLRSKNINNPKKKSYYEGQIDILLQLTDPKSAHNLEELNKNKKEELQFITSVFQSYKKKVVGRL